MPERENGSIESRVIIPEEIAKYSGALDILDLQEEQAGLVGLAYEKLELLDPGVIERETIIALEKDFSDLSGKVAKNLILKSSEETDQAEKERQAISDLIHLSLERRRLKENGLIEMEKKPSYLSTEEMQLEETLILSQRQLAEQTHGLSRLREERSRLPIWKERRKRKELANRIKGTQVELKRAQHDFEIRKKGIVSVSKEAILKRDELATKIKSALNLDQIRELTGKMRLLDHLIDIVLTIQNVLTESKSTINQKIRASQALVDMEAYLRGERTEAKKEKLGNSHLELLISLDLKENIGNLKIRLKEVQVDTEKIMVEKTTTVQGIITAAEIRGSALPRREEIQSLLGQLTEKFNQIKNEYNDVRGIFNRINQETDKFLTSLEEGSESDEEKQREMQRIEGLVYHLSQVDLKKTYLAGFDQQIKELDELIVALEERLLVTTRPERELPAHERELSIEEKDKKFQERSLDIFEAAMSQEVNKTNLIEALAGLDSDRAWDLREKLLSEGVDKGWVAVGLVGLDSDRAWDLREKLIDIGAKKGRIMQSLAGLDTERAWKMRQDLLDLGADKNTAIYGYYSIFQLEGVKKARKDKARRRR